MTRVDSVEASGAPPAVHSNRSRSFGVMTWFRAHPVIVVVLVALAVRLALIPPQASQVAGGDPARFVGQAEHILAGDGFLLHGEPCVHLPPGYPYFMAAVYSIHHSNAAVLAVQCALSIFSCALVFSAIRPRSRGLALIASIAMAIHLWSAYFCWQLMSECLGGFLAAALVYVVSRVEADEASEAMRCFRFALIGAIAAAAVLTSPSMLIASFGVLAVSVIWNLRRPAALLATLGGFALLMAPWQIHCHRTLGRFVPQVLDTRLHTDRGLATWQRTWMIRTQSPHQSAWGYFNWNIPGSTIDQVPARAFRSQEERASLQRLVEGWRAARDARPERERVFASIAQERIAESPLAFHVGLPLLRSALLWLEMPSVAYSQVHDEGPWSAGSSSTDEDRSKGRRMWRSAGLALFGGIAVLLHGVLVIYFVMLAAGALGSRRLMAVTLLCGVVGYTLVSAYFALSEFRRNFPFLPIMLFWSSYWPWTWGRSSAECGE